jgi:hypothetical protein
MPETRPPLNRRRARLLRLLWNQWDQDRAAHRDSEPITTSTVWNAWYLNPDGADLGVSRATARDDLAHLARAGHLFAYTSSSDGHRYYRLNTQSVDRAFLWLTALPADHPAYAPFNEAAARLPEAAARLLRTAFLRAFNTASCGYPLPALDAQAERLHNTARSHEDRIEAQGFDLGVTAARIAVTHRRQELADTA